MVRELTQKRVWFAAALISATAAEVQQLIAQAKAWAKRLDKKVVLWISDKQSAFVTGIAAEFPTCRTAIAQSLPAGCGEACAGGRQSRQGDNA